MRIRLFGMMGLAGFSVWFVGGALSLMPWPWWVAPMLAALVAMGLVGATGWVAWTERRWADQLELTQARWTIRRLQQLVRAQARRKGVKSREIDM